MADAAATTSGEAGADLPLSDTRAGAPAWPTVGLFFVLIAAGVVNVWLALTGTISLWTGLVVNMVLLYVMEHVNHEAIHRNICGARARLGWLNDLIGHVGNFWLFLPYAAFRAVHFAHHRHTNHPMLDGDMWFARKTPLGVALSCSTLLLGYEIRLQRLARLGRVPRGDMAQIYVTRLIWVGVVAAALAFGYGREAFLLWVLPALLVMPVLAFLFAYVVHYPHEEQAPHLASNVWLARGPMHSLLTAVFLFQNYHLFHHLHPRVPFYRYARLFEAIRPDLEAKGAPIRTIG